MQARQIQTYSLCTIEAVEGGVDRGISIFSNRVKDMCNAKGEVDFLPLKDITFPIRLLVTVGKASFHT